MRETHCSNCKQSLLNWSPINVLVSLPNCFLDLASAISEVMAGLGGRGGTYIEKKESITLIVIEITWYIHYYKFTIILKIIQTKFYIYMMDTFSKNECKKIHYNNREIKDGLEIFKKVSKNKRINYMKFLNII